MKMDAMQKRRMWKVAIAHFVLTGLIYVKWMCVEGQDYIQSIAMANFWADVFFLLQPFVWLVLEAGYKIEILDHFFSNISGGTMFAILLPLVPIWSICFAWILVKLDNWLNHFPVLGKKVF